MELVLDSTETDDESIIGEECHIVAKSQDGPRGKSDLSEAQRDLYRNLLLMCSVHHKKIDDQPEHYTVELLTQMKEDHLKWVEESLDGFDSRKQRDEEYYVSVIEELGSRLNIDNWQGWMSWVLSQGYPRIGKVRHEALIELKEWLLSRVWPRRYPELELSLFNLRLVIQDFLLVFDDHSEPFGEDMFGTKKFYQIKDWDPERYGRLKNQYDFHVDLVQDLAIEMTRAVNFVFDNVREVLLHSFRLKEGLVLVETGPFMDMTYKTLRLEYPLEARGKHPYPGLKEFYLVRSERDYFIGEGQPV